MNVDAILISDSEDEDVPRKKLKTEFVEKCNINRIRILKVTSLANTEKEHNSEIVIIDDDEEVKNNIKVDAGSCLLKNNLEPETNSDDQNEVEDKCPKEIAEHICDELSDTSATKAVCNNNEVDFEKENNESENVLETDGVVENKREISGEFLAFLDQCASCDCEKKYKDLIVSKIPKIKERYMQATPEFVKNKQFLTLLNSTIEKIQRKPTDAVVYFSSVYEELSAGRDRANVDLTERELKHLTKLEKVIVLLNKRIKKLEAAPVNWEDDNNSSYMQLDKYRKRLCDVHKKVCSYTNENPFIGRPMYRKLDFEKSNYSVINRAIDKLYNKTKAFPTYYDVDKCVKKCIVDNDLSISGDALELEIRTVFTEMGKLLQRRRKNELHSMLNDFLEDPKDPALENADLKTVLDKQHTDGVAKIEAVLQKYTDKQEAGEDPSPSSDTDDSNFQSETSESIE